MEPFRSENTVFQLIIAGPMIFEFKFIQILIVIIELVWLIVGQQYFASLLEVNALSGGPNDA